MSFTFLKSDIRGEGTDKDPGSASDEKEQREPEKSLNVKQQEGKIFKQAQ